MSRIRSHNPADEKGVAPKYQPTGAKFRRLRYQSGKVGRRQPWAPKWTADLTTDDCHPIGDSVTAFDLVDTITLDPLAEEGAYARVNARLNLPLMHGGPHLPAWDQNLVNRSSCINRPGLTTSTGAARAIPAIRAPSAARCVSLSEDGPGW